MADTKKSGSHVTIWRVLWAIVLSGSGGVLVFWAPLMPGWPTKKVMAVVSVNYIFVWILFAIALMRMHL